MEQAVKKMQTAAAKRYADALAAKRKERRRDGRVRRGPEAGLK